MQFTTVISFLLVVVDVVVGQPQWGFAGSCPNYALTSDGQQITGNCYMFNARERQTYMPLNNCLTNFNGALLCQSNGGAMESCGSCNLEVDGNGKRISILQCLCPAFDGTQVPTTIDLDGCLGNINGQFFCFGIGGT